MPLAQTVTVVNKSGKIVKTSKTLVNVFKEAKTAYLERRAEIKAVRQADLDERETRRALDRLDVDEREWDNRHIRPSSSRRSSQHSTYTVERKPVLPERPRSHRNYTETSVRSDRSRPTTPRSPRSSRQNGPSRLRFEELLERDSRESSGRALVRRNTDTVVGSDTTLRRPKSSRSASLDDIDMSLAYGELPPPLPLRPRDNSEELRKKVSKLQTLLDEANCLQHSALATIDSLQKNPEHLAAVALTLAEISNLAAKMAPAALTSMKTIFPAVFALLACPEFLIAAGVGVGVTIIALGGYKIIKKIRSRKDAAAGGAIEAPEPDADELQEIRSDLSRIEVWRRGIADAREESLSTSVDGEFITPVASRQLMEEGRLRDSDLKKKSKQEREREKKRREKQRRDSSHEEERGVFDKGKALILGGLFNKEKKAEPSLA